MFQRFFSSSSRLSRKVQALRMKGKKKSSQEWIQRQLSDPYVEKAHIYNYRCRSAFKLIEIDDRFKILLPDQGQVIVDCGAAPGSWSQVAAQRAGLASTIVAIDKLQFHPIEGVHIVGNQDFTQSSSHHLLELILDSRKANVVLSDMAPNATGVRSLDCENIIHLAYSVLKFALSVSATDATLLIKLWQCAQVQSLLADMRKFYRNVGVVKPHASRSDSTEIFILGRCFKGLSGMA